MTGPISPQQIEYVRRKITAIEEFLNTAKDHPEIILSMQINDTLQQQPNGAAVSVYNIVVVIKEAEYSRLIEKK